MLLVWERRVPASVYVPPRATDKLPDELDGDHALGGPVHAPPAVLAEGARARFALCLFILSFSSVTRTTVEEN